MALKNCIDCGKASHTDNTQCIYCGSSRFQTKDLLDSAWLIFAIFSILVVITFYYGNRVLNQLNVGVISARDFRNCTNDRIITSMKNTFNDSVYAQENNFTVKSLSVNNYPFQHPDAIIACKVNLTLSNNKKLTYIYQIKYIYGEYIFDYYAIDPSVNLQHK